MLYETKSKDSDWLLLEEWSFPHHLPTGIQFYHAIAMAPAFYPHLQSPCILHFFSISVSIISIGISQRHLKPDMSKRELSRQSSVPCIIVNGTIPILPVRNPATVTLMWSWLCLFSLHSQPFLNMPY